MRVVYFTETLPPLTDGVSRTLGRLFDHLDEKGVEFLIFSPVPPDPRSPWASRVRVLPSFPFPLYDYYRVSIPTEAMAREVEDFAPNLIHSISPTPCGVFGLAYAKKRGLPAVTSYHTHFVSYFKHYGFSYLERLGWAFLRWFHNQGLATYTPTSSTIQELNDRGFHHLEHWGRGIDLEKFSPGFRDEKWKEQIGAGKPLLLFVGRLVSEKDLDDLVKASEILRGRGYLFRLVFAGDGPMRAELKKRLPDAHFTGMIHGEELSRCYASCDLFVFPSTTETFGNVVQEAMASGLPVIGVRKGGVVDIIDHGVNGYLAEPHDPVEFASCVEKVLKDPEEISKLRKCALAASGKMSWDQIHGVLLKKYEQILAGVSKEKSIFRDPVTGAKTAERRIG